MFERAVVCTDLTPSSDELVGCAAALKALGMSEVVLAHVVDVFAGETGSEEGVSELFARQTAVLESAGLRVRVDAPVGHPSYAIEEVADRHDASVVVMGTRSRGLHDASFSGSVSSDLVHIGHRPLLLAPYEALGSVGSGRRLCSRLLSHVLFPTDLAEAGDRALRALAAIVPLGLERVSVLHVFEREGRPAESEAMDDRFERGMSEIRRVLGTMGAEDVRERMEYGNAPELVVEAANGGEYSMAVIAAPRSGTRVLTPSVSVTAAMVAGSTIPMLLVPPQARWPDRRGRRR